MNAPLWTLPAFALIASAYASVGLGGATAYAAVLSLTDVPYTQIPPLVLSLNLLVAGSAYASFHGAGRVPYSILAPLLATSIPAAFAGGLVPLRERHFLFLLAFALLLAGLRFLLGSRLRRAVARDGGRGGMSNGALLIVGLGIGLLAGMTGIGGGVYLAPILLLRGAGDLETVPAITSGFVFFNSAAGLAGHLTRIEPVLDLWIPLGAAAVVGAIAGAFAAVRWLPTVWTQRVFGAVLVVVAVLNGAKAL
ncbi:MAG: sulfite exporter TauE/SafE family protein [Candidatus Eisenbacteria bacterium]